MTPEEQIKELRDKINYHSDRYYNQDSPETVSYTHLNQTFDHVRRFFRIRLGGDTLIALAGSTRLICINTRNDDQTVGNILLDFCEAADIITDSVLTVCGTRSDDCLLYTSLNQRKDGRYQARFTSVNGKRKEKNFDKITEARNWLTEAKYKDSLLNNCNMTVDEWFDFWLNNYKEGIVANNTKKNYSNRYKNNIKEYIGNIQMCIRDRD